MYNNNVERTNLLPVFQIQSRTNLYCIISTLETVYINFVDLTLHSKKQTILHYDAVHCSATYILDSPLDG